MEKDDWQEVPVDDWEEIGAEPVAETPSVSTLESAIRGGVQGVPFIGSFADEAEGAVRALSQRIPYSEGRAQAREAFKAAQEANPITYGGAQVAGGVLGAVPRLVPGVGAAFGALEGGIYGLGASEADLTQGDITGAISDAGTGAAIGAAVPLAFAGAGKAIGKLGDVSSEALGRVAPRLAGRLQDFAEVQSARAQGLERGTLKKLGEKKVKEIGRFGLDAIDPLTGKPIVSGFASTDDMIARNLNIQKESGEAIGEIAEQIDRSGFRGFSPTAAAEKVESELGSFYRDPLNRSETNLLENALESIRMRGENNIGLQEAQELKKTLAKAANWKNNVAPTEKERLARQIYGTVSGMVDEATDKGAEALQNPALLSEFLDSKKLFGASKGAEELLTNKRAREAGNKMFGLTDTIIGAGGIGSTVATGGLGAGATIGILGAKKLGEKYGAQNMARSSDYLAKKVMSIPKLSSKYGKVLQDAAARGETSLAATHYILQQQDPEYREQMLEKGYEPSSGSQSQGQDQ